MSRLMLAGFAGLIFLSAAACSGAAERQVQGKGQAEPKAVEVQPSMPPAAADGSLTTAQVVAAAEQAFPEIQPYAYYASCDRAGQFTSCPFTDRLVSRLSELKETLMRGAQNPSTSREVTAELTGRTTGTAHVVLFNGRVHLDLAVVQSGGRVLVDDASCTAQPGTSVYDAFVPCDEN